jgi:arylsulfatase A-like enzyme
MNVERPFAGKFRFSDYIWTALFLALAAAVAELVVLEFRRIVLDRFIWSSYHIIWMTPASYLFLLLPPALGLATVGLVIHRRWPGINVLAALAFGLSATAIFGLLRLISLQRLHWASIAIVAMGVGIQVARQAHLRPSAFVQFARRWTLRFAAALLLVIVITEAYWWQDEPRAVQSPRARAGAPNIVLIILDTVRAASLSLYGYREPTSPELEKFARKGIVFERALSPAPWTLPAHASIFTGRQPSELRADFLTPFGRRYPTLAEVLSAQGYHTAAFSANHFYVTRETGLDRGFGHFEDYPISLKQTLKSSEIGQLLTDWRGTVITRASAPTLATAETKAFLDWTEAHNDAPFFAFINYMDAHDPYQSTAHFDSLFESDYDAAIASLDQQLGVLFREMESRHLLDNTLVVVTADHGEQFGEHGLLMHANSLYTQLLHVPLLIVQRGRVPAGQRLSEPVGLIDLGATILDLAQAQAELPGQTLARFWRDRGADTLVWDPIRAEVRRHPSANKNAAWRNRNGTVRAAFAERYHYIRNPNGTEELYDYWSDPAEEHDLARDSTQRDVLENMRAMLGHDY